MLQYASVLPMCTRFYLYGKLLVSVSDICEVHSVLSKTKVVKHLVKKLLCTKDNNSICTAQHGDKCMYIWSCSKVYEHNIAFCRLVAILTPISWLWHYAKACDGPWCASNFLWMCTMDVLWNADTHPQNTVQLVVTHSFYNEVTTIGTYLYWKTYLGAYRLWVYR